MERVVGGREGRRITDGEKSQNRKKAEETAAGCFQSWAQDVWRSRGVVTWHLSHFFSPAAFLSSVRVTKQVGSGNLRLILRGFCFICVL